ncbi:hypothetical protein L1887_22981 [Cichorium endivia]|nr:hypothetical protein L1887_22981 [Cichorium endivia]
MLFLYCVFPTLCILLEWTVVQSPVESPLLQTFLLSLYIHILPQSPLRFSLSLLLLIWIIPEGRKEREISRQNSLGGS